MMTRKSFDLVNGEQFRAGAALVLGASVLLAAAWLRGAEYDEQYTLFLTAGIPRPAWPDTPFPAGTVAAIQAGQAGFASIARDLRATDVHPPLYFWAVALWRAAFGPGLLAARLFSVLCGIGSLALVARLGGWRAVLLTAGCYGFVYTNAIARGFAPAETLLLAGTAWLAAGRPLRAGAAFGAACGCNYLAVFVAVAAGAVAAGPPGARRYSWLLTGAAPFLLLDAWFFAAQHGTRAGQFPPFSLAPSIVRAAGYQVAAVFGGLPRYWDGAEQALAVIAVGAAALVACWHLLHAPRLALIAAAPATGLLLLGAVFDNTPIELRYLSFALPFMALGVQGRGAGRCLIVAVQAAGIAGLLLAPRTMQPARAAAAEAAPFAEGALVLLPGGNDGVGIVGAFAIESKPTTMLQIVRGGEVRIPPEYPRVVLALLAQDRDSAAVLPAMRASVAGANWRRVAIRANLEVYERQD